MVIQINKIYFSTCLFPLLLKMFGDESFKPLNRIYNVGSKMEVEL